MSDLEETRSPGSHDDLIARLADGLAADGWEALARPQRAGAHPDLIATQAERCVILEVKHSSEGAHLGAVAQLEAYRDRLAPDLPDLVAAILVTTNRAPSALDAVARAANVTLLRYGPDIEGLVTSALNRIRTLPAEAYVLNRGSGLSADPSTPASDVTWHVSWRDSSGESVVTVLGPGDTAMVGRAADADIHLSGDPRVSRHHAVLRRVGDDLAVTDLRSTNGVFVCGRSISSGPKRLTDGDEIRVGSVFLTVRSSQPRPAAGRDAMSTEEFPAFAPVLTAMETAVLNELVRPALAEPQGAPASNTTIAAELHLTPDTVRKHMRGLYAKLDVESAEDPRRALMAVALQAGLVPPADS